jgi:hypothetical protein
MSFSRRDFLEASALSASGLVLANLVPQANAIGESPESGNEISTGEFHRPAQARTVLSMNHKWQFFRPRESSIPARSKSESAMLPPQDADWEPASLPRVLNASPGNEK